MEQTVYGDILFFVNFCMDFQCLFLTAKLLHRPFSVLKGAIFSAFGAFYACAALFLSVSGAAAFFADCGVCFLMCWGTFGGKRGAFRQVFLPFGLYFGVSLAVGGIMSGMASLLSRFFVPSGAVEQTSCSWGFFLLAACVISMFSFLTIGHLNYALDIKGPQPCVAVIEDKDIEHHRRGPDTYEFRVTVDGESFDLDVTFVQYHSYEVGDTYTFDRYEGAFGKPFYLAE